jgi:endonuclease/exonuclease/phosphatase family metal-dependent hydrolase
MVELEHGAYVDDGLGDGNFVTARSGFKLLTFNVHNLGRADNSGSRTYQAKIAYLADVLGRLDADVAVIDEVREPESFDELADRLGTYAHRFLGDAPPANRRIQIGILSKLPILEQGQWREFPAALPGPDGEAQRLAFRRVMPWLRLELPNGETLMVVAVHLKSRRAASEEIPETEPPRRRRLLGRALSNLIRIAEAAGLRCLMDEAMDRKTADHYVVLGDFNDTPHSTAVSLVMGLEDEEGSELVQSEERRLFQTSWRVPPERAFSYVGRGQRHLFDHILVSQRLSLGLVTAGIESQLLEAERRLHSDHPEGYPRSDHAPVWAAFELPPGP